MEAININGTWEEQKNKLKIRFGIIQDSDLILEEGLKQELITKLQIKLGKSREELHNILNEL